MIDWMLSIFKMQNALTRCKRTMYAHRFHSIQFQLHSTSLVQTSSRFPYDKSPTPPFMTQISGIDGHVGLRWIIAVFTGNFDWLLCWEWNELNEKQILNNGEKMSVDYATSWTSHDRFVYEWKQWKGDDCVCCTVMIPVHVFVVSCHWYSVLFSTHKSHAKSTYS